MKQSAQKPSLSLSLSLNGRVRRAGGFTIVELLIVIVIIAILASITIVAYNGIQDRARAAVLSSELSSASQQLKLDQADTGKFPDTLAAANGGQGLKASPGTMYQYSVNNTANPATFCLMAYNGKFSYSITESTTPTSGSCPEDTISGLIGWWKFNGNANDSSPSGNNGTVNGATLTNGANGSANGAYNLNGTSDYINAGPVSLPKFTVSSWVKPNGVQTASASVIADVYPNNVNYALFFAANSLTLQGGIYNAGWTGTPTVSLTDNTWAHITMTYDGNTMVLYFNGSLVGTTPYAATPASSGRGLNIGKRWDYPNYFKGAIDDTRIYNRALSASEVQFLYSSGAQ